MKYLSLFVLSFLLLSGNMQAVEEKSQAMKSLKQKFTQEHKSHGANHIDKKPVHQNKDPLQKKIAH